MTSPLDRAMIADAQVMECVRLMRDYKQQAKRPLIEQQRQDMQRQADKAEALIVAWRRWQVEGGESPGARFASVGGKLVEVQ